jgi:Flp pilus assembly pilin Flp
MHDLMIRKFLALHARAASMARDERGQTTAEYALVMLGAAGVAMLLLGWATRSGAIGDLFDVVLSGIVGQVK